MSMFWIVCIVAIACATAVVMQHLNRNGARRADEVSPDADTEQKLDRLEERIRVLERIVTEHRTDLKREIDSL